MRKGGEWNERFCRTQNGAEGGSNAGCEEMQMTLPEATSEWNFSLKPGPRWFKIH
jgi:hypothetical protein